MTKPQNQDGFALLIVLFLLASGTAIGLLVMGNGLAARKLTRVASQSIALNQRAATMTWAAIDGLGTATMNGPPPLTQMVIDGSPMSVEQTPETGRIDLNGLSRSALAGAIKSLGFPDGKANQAADQIAIWRDMDPPSAGGLNLTMHGRTALWSVDDIDVVPDLDGDVRACLRRWGSVHARGPFRGITALMQQRLSTVSDATGATSVMAGSMIRIVVTDVVTGTRFRTIILYQGASRASSAPRSPWLILEWLHATSEARDACPIAG